jgi:hypothetical protein
MCWSGVFRSCSLWDAVARSARPFTSSISPQEAGFHRRGATLNSDALRTVLDFYAQARVAGLIDSTVLDYTSPEDYLPALVGGQIDVGVVNSTLFLILRADGHFLFAAPLPTPLRLATWIFGCVGFTSNADRRAMASVSSTG